MEFSEAHRRVVEILARWERGEIEPWDVLDEAENLEVELLKMYRSLDYPKDDYRSIVADVVGMLAIAHHEKIMPDDIPALRRLLSTHRGQEAQAWRAFNHHLDRTEGSDRTAAAELLWYGKRISRL